MSEQNVQVTQALEPCECGSEPSLYEDERDGARLHQVRCENCDTRGPAIEGCSVSYLGKARIDAHRAEAIAAWNHRTRAEPDLVEAARDVVTDAEEFGILDGLREDGSPIDTLAVRAEPIRRLRAALSRSGEGV